MDIIPHNREKINIVADFFADSAFFSATHDPYPLRRFFLAPDTRYFILNTGDSLTRAPGYLPLFRVKS